MTECFFGSPRDPSLEAKTVDTTVMGMGYTGGTPWTLFSELFLFISREYFLELAHHEYYILLLYKLTKLTFK